MPEMTPKMREAEEREGRALREVLVERYRAQTMQEIADHYGVSNGTVSQWFLRLSIPTSHNRQRDAEAVA